MHTAKTPVFFFQITNLQDRNLNVKLLGSGLMSRSKNDNSNITDVLLYVMVGIFD